MVEIVLCALSAKYIHSSLAPWCLAAGLEKYCDTVPSVHVEHATINEPIEAVLRRILDLKPRIVGLSCYIWNIDRVMELSHLIKENDSNIYVVLGGPEVSFRAAQVLRDNADVDFVFSGEGEKPFALLTNALLLGTSVQDLPGLCYRTENGIVEAQPYVSDEEPPSPYTPQYLEQLKGKIAYLETSRGCPYSCAFCLSGRCGKARFFDIDRAKQDMLTLANAGAKVIKLVDRTFNASRKRADELFAFIIDNYGGAIPQGVCFHFEIAGDLLSDKTLALLKTAPVGSMQMEIGLQSFNTQTLDAIQRKTNIEKLKNNIKALVDNGNMHIHIDLIAGLPYEDFLSFRDSFNTAFYLNPNMLQLGFLKLLYGSQMREEPENYPCEYASGAPYEVISTPWLQKEDVVRLHHLEDALERLCNSGRFRRTVSYLLENSEKTPFDILLEFGEHCAFKGVQSVSLNEYIELILNWFGEKFEYDKGVLRDLLVCDFLSTNSQGRLPKVLQIADNRLNIAKRHINEVDKQLSGVKRGVALLYHPLSAVYADYTFKNPVNGEYDLKKLDLPDCK